MTGTSQRYIKYLAAGVIAFAVGGLGALGVAMGSTPQTAPPPLACTGQIDPVAGGTLRCVPAGPTTSPKPTPSAGPSASGSASIPPTAAPTTPAPTMSTPKPSPSSPAPTTTTPTGLTYVTVYRTLYDVWDNDCGGPGDCTAYPPGHAGGDGSYGSPITIAVKPGAYPVGTMIYDPLLGYGKVGDDCMEGCSGGQLDWWADGSDLPKAQSQACLESLTGRFPVVVNPPAGLPMPGTGPIASKDGCGR